jgi:formiminotetrahydrofolate cyclodeaminase
VPTAATTELLTLPVGELLEGLATDAPVPGAGAVGALSAAMAAGLVGMVASGSPGWQGAAGAQAQATKLRARLAPLAGENAEAYERALAALAAPVRPGSPPVGDALRRAAEPPLRIAAGAADVALLAAHAAEEGEPSLRPDAAAAAALADAAARIACHLVEINLTTSAEDERLLAAQGHARAAAEAAARALQLSREAP